MNSVVAMDNCSCYGLFWGQVIGC